ncbi:transposase [Corallococcus sp. AS-1-12]|uniref:transposase n=1 Tax=Corallococcus sp. AS-1-12 TaxID=2874598 RepID=UPI001CBB82B7|nr:transposase [Corallococcus sp. AS-1-12]MBZ4334874.1 transposase [Corallococcus sp. AS-1-12]
MDEAVRMAERAGLIRLQDSPLRVRSLLAQVADVGPRHDTCEVQQRVLQSQHRHSSSIILADAGDDSTRTLRRCRTHRLRPISRVKLPPPSRVQNRERRSLLLHLPRRLYARRWQAESFFSSLKRRFGDVLAGRTWRQRVRETLLHGVLHNCALRKVA